MKGMETAFDIVKETTKKSPMDILGSELKKL
jgi:ribosomal protein S7